MIFSIPFWSGLGAVDLDRLMSCILLVCDYNKRSIKQRSIMDIQDIQMQISETINSSIESIEVMGKARFYDEFDFPKDEREAEGLIDFIAGSSRGDSEIDFEVGFLKGLEFALRIVMK